MKLSEAIGIARYIAGAYRTADTSESAIAVLADQVLDLDHETTRRVARGIVAAGGAFPPTPSEIRNAYFVALHRLPSTAAIVNAIAAARLAGRVEDATYAHPIIREVVLEVGPSKIHEDWTYALREVVATAERLRAEFLRAVNIASLEGRAPELDGRLALIARGLDPYQRPTPPSLPSGWTFHGWSLSLADSTWKGNATGPRTGDFRHFASPLLYARLDVASLPAGAPGALALPAGGWTPPEVTSWGSTHEALMQPAPARVRGRAAPQAPPPSAPRVWTAAELEARKAEVRAALNPDDTKGSAA